MSGGVRCGARVEAGVAGRALMPRVLQQFKGCVCCRAGQAQGPSLRPHTSPCRRPLRLQVGEEEAAETQRRLRVYEQEIQRVRELGEAKVRCVQCLAAGRRWTLAQQCWTHPQAAVSKHAPNPAHNKGFFAPPSALPQAKFDLVAASNLEKTLHPEWDLWAPVPGHRSGVPLGLRVDGRGALKALGVHTTYYTGIET